MSTLRAGDRLRGNSREYVLLHDLTVKDAGTSRWGFVKSGDTEYFIKEHTSPKWPSDSARGSEAGKQRRRDACDRFATKKKALHEALNSVGKAGSTLIPVDDFFRNGSFYYTVTRKVDTAGLSVRDVSRLSPNDRLVIAASFCNALQALHSTGVVHSDLKPENVLIKATAKSHAARLIDFDASFVADHPPDAEDAAGSPEYFSPELLAYAKGVGAAESLSINSDVFAAGLLLVEYFTGTKVDYGEFSSPAHAVNEGFRLGIPGCDEFDVELIVGPMLSPNPADRPSMMQVQNLVKKERRSPSKPKGEPSSADGSSSLPGSPTTGKPGKLRTPRRKDPAAPVVPPPSDSKLEAKEPAGGASKLRLPRNRRSE